MEKQENIVRPISHRELRAFVDMVEKAIQLGDGQLMWRLVVISHLIPPQNNQDIYTYAHGEYDQHFCENDHYPIHTKEHIALSKDNLKKLAYGDFNEAMWELEMEADYIFNEKRESDIFRPEYFDKEDRKIWHKLRSDLDYVRSSDLDMEQKEIANHQIIYELRNYQQKSYGPLIPVIIAFYLKDDGKRDIGASIRLAWMDDTLCFTKYDHFSERVDEYFKNKRQIQKQADFTESVLPIKIDGYKLESVSCYDLFRYEL